MSLLYEEKIAKRFAKIKPADFDFWTELDSVIREAFLFNKTGKPVDFWNREQKQKRLKIRLKKTTKVKWSCFNA